MFRFLLISLAFLLFTGCADTIDPPPPYEGQTLEFVDLEHADSVNAWRVQAPKMSMWLEAAPEARHSHNQIFWTMSGRVSKDIEHIRAFVSGRRYIDAEMVSPRKFRLLLNEKEMSRVLTGDPIFMEFEPEGGSQDYYSGMISIRAKLSELDGTHRVSVGDWLVPILTMNGIVMRANVETEPGFELQYVFTDDDQDPELTFNPGWLYWVDWRPESLQYAADFPDDPVYFYVYDGADSRYQKKARIALRVAAAGLSIKPPEDAWPPPVCLSEVDRCITDLPVWANDTSTCGDATVVQACLNLSGG